MIMQMAGIGGLFGVLIGIHFISRANPKSNKLAGYVFFLVMILSIGITTLFRHFNGILIDSLNVVSALFISVGLAMLVGGMLSAVFSKNT